LNNKTKDNFVPSEPDGQQSEQQNGQQTTQEQDPYAEFGEKITVDDNDLPF